MTPLVSILCGRLTGSGRNRLDILHQKAKKNPIDMSWKDYLPSVLQLSQVYWIIAVSIATVCGLRAIPLSLRQPWIIQLGTLCVSISFSVALLGRAGIVYAFGASIICSSLATSFYDIFFSAIEAKIRAILGVNSNTQMLPRSTNPESVIK